MIDVLNLRKIKSFAIDLDWHKAFGGKSRGNRHLFRVAKIACFLAKKERANLNICLAGAWLHDVGLIKGNENHPTNGAKIADEFLESLRLTKRERKAITHCVKAHEGTIRTSTKEAKIVHDADVLDKSGLMGLIRHVWKLVNTNKKPLSGDEISQEVKRHIFWRQKQLQTNSAKKISKIINKKANKCFKSNIDSKKFVRTIIPLAKKGLISDIIAQFLINRGRHKGIREILNWQLKCQFLEEANL